MQQQPGIWKEGRQGGASLCYIGLDDEAIEMVMPHHADVGIRATLACEEIPTEVDTLLERNWELAVHGDEQLAVTTAAALQICDSHHHRGWILPHTAEADDGAAIIAGPHNFVAYRVVLSDGVIAQPQPELSQPLPARWLPDQLQEAKDAITGIVDSGQWAIWLVDAATLERMGPTQHRQLMQWLGDHHTHIWCAPIRDIANWKGSPE